MLVLKRLQSVQLNINTYNNISYIIYLSLSLSPSAHLT